jgi:transposase
MYIATVPNRGSPPAILLRESFRQHGKVNSRTLANISSWPRARIDALRRLLRGELDTATAPDPTLGPVFGLLFALKQLADALGLTAAFGKSRLAKLALFLVLARVAHQGSCLSAVRWAEDHAVREVLDLESFDENDLYAALDDLRARQHKIEQALYRRYLERRGSPPTLFLYDVTSSYLEGEHNALGEFGYNRDGKRGKLQIVIGLLADNEGEPLATRVFAGNIGDPATVAEQIKIVKEQFGVEELVFVGDRGMVKSKGKQALEEAGLRHVPRKNEAEAARQRHRLDDKLAKLTQKMEQRNQQVKESTRCKPEAGQRQMQAWIARYKLTGLVDVGLEDRALVLERKQAAVERDFRQMKTGLLEVRPVFVRKESRTRGHVFCCMLALKISREMERRLQAVFGTADADPHAITPADAITALSRLCLLEYQVDAKTTVTRLPKPDARQKQILEALQVHLPEK